MIYPDWPAPSRVRAFTTTRRGGVSKGEWRSLNFGLACGDEPTDVATNREKLRAILPADPLWLRQVHGNSVVDAEDDNGHHQADGSVTSFSGKVLTVLTADCLPVLLCDDQGSRVGVAHAGWRGLAGGVIEATVTRMDVAPGRLIAWLGPAISGENYQVGREVRDAFAASQTFARLCHDKAFVASEDRWHLDLTKSARIILAALGVERVYGGGFCTFNDSARFFSHRRDRVTGRMSSLIWLD
jgi:YfiH family protein